MTTIIITIIITIITIITTMTIVATHIIIMRVGPGKCGVQVPREGVGGWGYRRGHGGSRVFLREAVSRVASLRARI